MPVVVKVVCPVDVATQVLARNDYAHVLVASGGPLVKLVGTSQLDSFEVDSGSALADDHGLSARKLPGAGLESNFRMALANFDHSFVGVHPDSVSALHHRTDHGKGRFNVSVGIAA